MPIETIEKEKIALEKKKKQLQLKQRLIKEKEKQAQARKFSEIGKLAHQANIDLLDGKALLGAFLEIEERNREQKHLAHWREKAKNFLEAPSEKTQDPLIISFPSDPSSNIKSLLREMNFKWNNFRREFYGYGHRKSIEEALFGTNSKIEVAE